MIQAGGAPHVSTALVDGALLSYIESMLLELAHMAAEGGEPALAASLAIAAIQCGARLKAVD